VLIVSNDRSEAELQKKALQCPQKYLRLKGSGILAPSRRCSTRNLLRSQQVREIKGGGRVRKSIRIDRFKVMLYGMIQYKLMGKPSRTSVFYDC